MHELWVLVSILLEFLHHLGHQIRNSRRRVKISQSPLLSILEILLSMPGIE